MVDHTDYLLMTVHYLALLSNGAVAIILFCLTLFFCRFLASNSGGFAEITLKAGKIADGWLTRQTVALFGLGSNSFRHWTIFWWIEILLVLATAFGPGPIAFCAPILSFLIALYLFRTWLTGIEDQRTGAVPSKIDIGANALIYGVDDEPKRFGVTSNTGITICSIALLFSVASIGFSRVDELSKSIGKTTSTTPSYIIGAAQVLGEIPESVPILDASSVFRSGNLLTNIQYKGSLIKLSTFILRISYEIFLVTALLQILKVYYERNSKDDIEACVRGLSDGKLKTKKLAVQRLSKLGASGNGEANGILSKVLFERIGNSNQHAYAIELRVLAADSLLFISEMRGKKVYTYEAISAYSQILNDDFHEYLHTNEKIKAQIKLGRAYGLLAYFTTGDPAMIRVLSALKILRGLSDDIDPVNSPEEWVEVQLNLTSVLGYAANRLGADVGLDLLLESRGRLLDALPHARSQLSDRIHSSVLCSLSSCEVALSGMRSRDELESLSASSVARARLALAIVDKDRDTLHWARAQSSLGYALGGYAMTKANEDESLGQFKLAAVALKQALSSAGDDEYPFRLIEYNNNYAAIISNIARKQGGSAAEESFDIALEIYTRVYSLAANINYGVGAGLAQMSLGLVANWKARISEAGSKSHLRQRAAFHFELAGDYFGRDDFFSAWMTLQNHKADLLIDLFEDEPISYKKGELILQAIELLDELSDGIRRESAGVRANVHTLLGYALFRRATLTEGPIDFGFLDRALRLYTVSIREYGKVGDIAAVLSTYAGYLACLNAGASQVESGEVGRMATTGANASARALKIARRAQHPEYVEKFTAYNGVFNDILSRPIVDPASYIE